jgi:hypothetical protein
LKLKYDEPLSNFAYKFNLRRYTTEEVALGYLRVANDVVPARYSPPCHRVPFDLRNEGSNCVG